MAKSFPNYVQWQSSFYKSLIVNDMKIRVQAPKEVANYISTNKLFSRSGHNLCGEVSDYVTENKNGHLKSHLPSGAPTLQSWIISCRNHQTLDKSRSY